MSSPAKRINGLEIDEDLPFQETMWKAQRVAWALMALLILAALVGLLGSGLISNQQVGEPGDSLWIEYERFVHLLTNHSLEFHISSEAGSPEEVSLAIDRNYLGSVELQQITPQPDSVSAASDRIIYTFKRAAENEALDVTFEIRPKDYGRLNGRMGLEGGKTHSLNQFVYP